MLMYKALPLLMQGDYVTAMFDKCIAATLETRVHNAYMHTSLTTAQQTVYIEGQPIVLVLGEIRSSQESFQNFH